MKNIQLNAAFRHIEGLILIAVFLMGTASCSHRLTQNLSERGSAKDSGVSANSAIPMEQNLTVEGVTAILEYAKEHPRKEESIIADLTTPFRYAECSYRDLCDLSMVAVSYGYDELSVFYDGLVSDREDSVIGRIGDMTLSDAAAYYRANACEMPFLDLFFSESLLPELDSVPLKTVNYIRELFSGTNISPDIDAVYWSLRDSVRETAVQELEIIRVREEDCLKLLREYVYSSVSDYVDSALIIILDKGMERVDEGILRQCFRINEENKHKSERGKEAFIKSKEESVETLCTYFRNLCSQYLKSESVRDTLQLYLGRFSADGNALRREYLSYWTDNNEIPVSLSMPDVAPVQDDFAEMTINMTQIRGIAADKYSARVQDAVWDAIGFIPVVGDILTIPDVAWNIYRGTKDEKKQNEQLLSFCEELRKEAMKCCASMIEKVSDRYKEELANNYSNIKRYVYENF